ncbi:MAG: hypothetical protein SFX73_11140 [Kofleriaceae bacterium]|nr:hypothetical protein [Kofleriaceae bacterium]
MKIIPRLLPLALVPLIACASNKPTKATTVRYANQPIVTRVADKQNTPKIPAERLYLMVFYQFDGSFYSRVMRGLSLPRPQRAQGINALDEVPDSTWFTNRITKEKLTPEEVHAGPAVSGNPEEHLPWTVVSTKTGGVTPGLVIKDARGYTYLLKFDLDGLPETETAAAVIANRLVWAAGFNVPEDYVVKVNRSDIRLVASSTYKDLNKKRPMRPEDLQRIYDLIVMGPNGEIRGMASRIVEGKALGGHPDRGVRRDDPNDVIPHELRRDLRGLYAMFAWIDQTDVKESNTLDVWIPNPANPKDHYVKHYHVDFGSAFGAMAAGKRDQRRGYVYAFDPVASLTTFLSVGTNERVWEDRTRPTLTGVGLYEAHNFDPGKWRTYTPSYLPLLVADRIDNYWATKIIMSFTPQQIRAAVKAGRLSDPIAEEYLAQQIILRQRATGQYWFSQVNPLDRFRVMQGNEGVYVCFDDLMLTNHLVESAANTRYHMVTANRYDQEISQPFSIRAQPNGHNCTSPLTVAPGGDRYTILKLTTRGRGKPLSTHVHLARNPTNGQFRVIGVYRK